MKLIFKKCHYKRHYLAHFKFNYSDWEMKKIRIEFLIYNQLFLFNFVYNFKDLNECCSFYQTFNES